LESDNRPHFFAGVALIVNKLLSQSQADVAIFGEKDYQQLRVICRMVRDLDLPVEILGGPIIREPDGLAMSSRNVYLTAAQRPIAGKLNGILKNLAASTKPREAAEAEAEAALLAAGFTHVDYATIRDADSLAVPDATTQSRRALIVARLGDVRLLDNMAAI
jgi:pantoate--beta-alanine ligase